MFDWFPTLVRPRLTLAMGISTSPGCSPRKLQDVWSDFTYNQDSFRSDVPMSQVSISRTLPGHFPDASRTLPGHFLALTGHFPDSTPTSRA